MIYDGLRVVDATHDLAGAYCAKLLTDLGADVVAVDPIPDDRGELYTYLRTSQRVGAGSTAGWSGAADIVLGDLSILAAVDPRPLVRVPSLCCRRGRARSPRTGT